MSAPGIVMGFVALALAFWAVNTLEDIADALRSESLRDSDRTTRIVNQLYEISRRMPSVRKPRKAKR